MDSTLKKLVMQWNTRIKDTNEADFQGRNVDISKVLSLKIQRIPSEYSKPLGLCNSAQKGRRRGWKEYKTLNEPLEIPYSGLDTDVYIYSIIFQ